jgi:sugar lactone lactonase YvrE
MPHLPYYLLAAAALAGCDSYQDPAAPDPVPPGPTLFTAIGDSAAVVARVNEFRTALGGVANGGTTPPQPSGRREIGWDGVPANLTNVDNFPAEFFNVNVKRGVVFTTNGTGFRVDSTDFAATNAAFGAEFRFFSQKRTFMPVGSNRMDVHFQIVGLPIPGLVNGFGVVFSDVDRAGSTRLEYFDADGKLLATVEAPARAGKRELAFVGAVFGSSIVARVRIVSGQAALGGSLNDVSAGGTADLVIMDDFILGEPQPFR